MALMPSQEVSLGKQLPKAMKTIIAATDYSPTAENALDYAARLASHMGMEITAVQCILFIGAYAGRDDGAS